MTRRVCVEFIFFSSRRQHTRWPGDWSSDVCSSDLDRKRGIYSVLPAVFRGQLLRRTDEGIYRCGDHSPGQIIDDVKTILMNKVIENRDQLQRGISGRDDFSENLFFPYIN